MSGPKELRPVNTDVAKRIATFQQEHRTLLEKKRGFELARQEAEEGERATEARLRVIESFLDGVGHGQQFQRDFDAAQKEP